MRYQRNDRVISGRLNDELVMMDINMGKYFGLNSVATRVWDLLESPGSIDDLVAMLTEEYDVSADECQEDVSGYIKEMVRLGLVIVVE